MTPLSQQRGGSFGVISIAHVSRFLESLYD